MSGDDRTVYEGKYLRVKNARNWEYVERRNVSGVVVILPLTSDGKIILVEQFRPAVAQNVVGLPAGLAGDQGKEELEEAARRELLEETGYKSDRWKLLTDGPSSPGLTNEFITFFLAADATQHAEIDPGADEQIEVHEVALRDLTAWLARKKQSGVLIDYKIFTALYLAPPPVP
jgi:ADP-ribose pyrophosphatase